MMIFMEEVYKDWDNICMDKAVQVAENSTCLRRKVGAVLERNGKILSHGANGAPQSLNICHKDTCFRQIHAIPSGEDLTMCRAIHAEQRAIIGAYARKETVQDATIYITHSPCVTCAKLIMEAGISRIFYKEEYPSTLAFELLDEAGISLIKMIKCTDYYKPASVAKYIKANEGVDEN